MYEYEKEKNKIDEINTRIRGLIGVAREMRLIDLGLDLQFLLIDIADLRIMITELNDKK